MNSKKDNKRDDKKIIAIVTGVIIIIVIVITAVCIKMARQGGEGSSREDPPPIEERYFSKENEEEKYTLESDKEEKVAGLTFYGFKMKNYKNGYQKIELMVRNDGTKTSKKNKKFIIEPIGENGLNDIFVNTSVKALKPGESTKLEEHIPGDIKGIVNFRVKEYLSN